MTSVSGVIAPPSAVHPRKSEPRCSLFRTIPFWAFLDRKLLVKPYAEIPSSSHIPQKSHRERRRKIALASKKNMGENEEEEEEGEINP